LEDSRGALCKSLDLLTPDPADCVVDLLFRRLHVMMSFLALPIIVVLVDEDAFYWKFTEESLVPSLLVASVIGLCCAVMIHRTSEIDRPPWYNNMFAVLGFVVALVFIYAISEEVVSIIRSFGLMWGIPTSIVAMAVLGAGNGTCDLVSNYIIASQGACLRPRPCFPVRAFLVKASSDMQYATLVSRGNRASKHRDRCRLWRTRA